MQSNTAQQTEARGRRFDMACTAWQFRLRGATLGVLCWTVITLAAMLSPRVEGYGTHEQLGFPPCSFLAKYHWPCPTCGLTTSVSATVHGQLATAWHANAFGPPLTMALLVCGAAGLLEILTGRDCQCCLRPGLWCLWAPALGVLAGWAINLAAGCASGRWPLP
jgi:hypothetical protein